MGKSVFFPACLTMVTGSRLPERMVGGGQASVLKTDGDSKGYNNVTSRPGFLTLKTIMSQGTYSSVCAH
jgi:hypothetical protein